MYPMVETCHIFGFAVLVGAVALFDLRLLGCARALPLRALAAHLLPWAVGSLLLVVPAGLLMFSTQPRAFLANPAFQLKMTLLLAAALNAAAFHLGIWRRAASWNADVKPPWLARVHALLSLALWFGVIACGRLLAYL
ncbi:hypothetical protein C9I28_21505 [Pseudoduganella armeniaca]|uniref:DUF6644 domain-containing protein n=1 Tax=Pseudoduganella armeniaca TaxID=2072590 RepID=A0A2R4CI35_9BURK|nr:hypothetical protein C9I28_21505 [Pseudoduganella armeniaca]